MRWRGLPIQLFIVTILPLTLLVLAIAFGSLLLHQSSMRQLVAQRDERAVRAAASALTEQLKHREAAIRSLALRAVTDSSLDHILTDAVFLLADFDGGIAIFDDDLQLLASSNETPYWELSLAQLLDQLPSQNEAVYTDWFTDQNGDTLLAVVIQAQEGPIVAGAFAPGRLANQALSSVLSSDEQAAAWLSGADGRVLFQVGEGRRADAVDGLQEGSGTRYELQDGAEFVIAYSTVPPLNWVLAIQEPWQAVTDPLLRLTEWTPLVLAPVLVIALIGLVFGLRQIVQPLQTLEKQAVRLGWGDFSAIESPVGGIQEIQRLQDELIHMARKVNVAQQGLRGYLGAVTTGQEEERRRLARDLHDDTLQSLIALNQRVQLAQLTAVNSSTVAQLEDMQQMAEQTIADLRRLTRDLRPIYLEDLGLVAALHMLARDTGQALGIPVTIQVIGDEQRLPAEAELAFYRIAQESLSNVARHAQAGCAEITLRYQPEKTSLVIKDDGRGFSTPDSPAEMASEGHFGLLGIQERAESIGASFQVRSASHQGTELVIELPARL